MKTLFYILIILSLISCHPNDSRTKFTKPFVIYNIGLIDNNNTHYYYQFQDNNGYKSYFTEKRDKYNIGDTIK